IGMVLESKPLDRRGLIEEAARISLFKSRRRAAQMKLELSQQNLARLDDILHEVDRQLNSLQRQAARARSYYRMRERLRGVLRLKLALEFQRLEGLLDAHEAKLARVRCRESELTDRIRALESELRTLHEGLASREEHLESLRQEQSEVALLLDRARNQKAHLEQQAELVRQRLQALLVEEERLEARGLEATGEQEELQSRQGLLERDISALEQALHQQQTVLEESQAAIAECERHREQLHRRSLVRAGELAEVRNRRAQWSERAVRVAGEMEKRRGEHARLSQEIVSLEERRRSVADQGAQLSRQLEAARNEVASKSQVLALLEQQRGIQELELEKVEGRRASLGHRLASLDEIESRRAHYAEGVQKFLAGNRESRAVRSAGTLAELVEADPQYEPVIESFLNDQLQYIVVEDLDEALKGLHQVKDLNAGRCTFFSLSGLGAARGNGQRLHLQPNGNGVIGYLTDLLRMDGRIKEAFERALPEVASTVVVANLEVALNLATQHPDATYLTLSGETLLPTGLLSGLGDVKRSSGLLSVKREKRNLAEQLEQARADVVECRRRRDELEEQWESCRSEMESLKAEVHRTEVEAARVEQWLAQVASELHREVQARETVDQELRQLQREAEECRQGLDETTRGLAVLEDSGGDPERALEELLQRSTQLRVHHQGLAAGLTEVRSRLAAQAERLKGLSSDQARIAREIQELGARRLRNREESAALEQRLKEAQEASRELVRQIGEEEQRVPSLRAQLEELEATRDRFRHKIRETEDALSSSREELHACVEERSSGDVERARCENDLEHLRRQGLEEFQTELEAIREQVAEQLPAADAARVDEEHEILKNKLQHFGAINMRALEEYQELEGRRQFLAQQQNDLLQSMADTKRAIAEINQRSLERFQEAFQQINLHFQELFKILFGGGECRLRLMDEEDPLESGIDIEAQPPGKRLQNLLLLSGGEKALTAIALLLAIFKFRPSPFCVLDEVDAPLDDTNVQRFTDIVSQMSQQTQFVVITHNKKTMTVVQSLYGITMEEPGVSTVVSVRFQKPEGWETGRMEG
ncbi:MAG: chromosome segregation protein SMC, partial [Acidobacteria bacterium]|nr:chromosome segregation protein SMC [Acidobacteriota bacterium]